ncbi:MULTISPECIES: hypothetical protein [unclassified Brevundimonas]|uniref:hypothetical protein n=1 Tax=unclassified Brevundimonas TaxID=2622653 RepID=UPI003F8FCFAE
MSRIDDDTLMRRIDGELSPREAEQVDAAALAYPEVAARLEDMRRLRATAREAFPVAADPRDQALARLIAAGAAQSRSPLAGLGRALADASTPRRAALWGGLATAAFAGGVLLGPYLGQADRGFAVGAGGALKNAGLVRVLDTRLAADGADADGRSVGLTFRDDEGRWCRTFRADEARLAGLACRGHDGWAMQALAATDGAASEVRTAAADTPDAVLAAVDAVISGETLDAPAEARARDAGWR